VTAAVRVGVTAAAVAVSEIANVDNFHI